MSGFGGVWPRLLDEAITAARRTLQDLDQAEVPASLAKVAASQGGRLPPPMATRLLAELDSNEWLRDKVAEDFTADEGPSWLFLNRPDGWWLSLAEAAGDAEQGDLEREMHTLENKLAAAEERKAAATKRAKEYKKAAAEATARAKRAGESVRSDVAAGVAGERAEAEKLRSELDEVRGEFDALQTEHEELQTAFHGLRKRYARNRRTRPLDDPGGGGTAFVPGDPIKLARMVDLQSAAFGRDMTDPHEVAGPATDPLVLEAGVRPDSSDAIRWLIGLEEAVVVLVDGYNAQFHIDGSDFTSGSSRRNLLEALQRLRNATTAAHRIVVVYDSALPGFRDPRTSLGGIEVRFAADDRIADEEIIDMAAELPRAVVVSSDREVREGAERNGAVVLWSEALADWVGRI